MGGVIGSSRSTNYPKTSKPICKFAQNPTLIFLNIDWLAPQFTARICDSVVLIGVLEVVTHLLYKSFPESSGCGRSNQRYKIDHLPHKSSEPLLGVLPSANKDWLAPPCTARIRKAVWQIGEEKVWTHLSNKSFRENNVCGRRYRQHKVDQLPQNFQANLQICPKPHTAYSEY